MNSTAIGVPLVRAPRERVRDAVAEERAVREPGDRVVEGLVGELLLERLALADVARVQDDAADVLVVDQVGVPDLELELGAVAVHERALERVAVVLEPRRLEDVRDAAAVGGCDEGQERRAVELVGAVAEQPLDRRAEVADLAAGVEHGDEVVRVRDEGLEPGLALAAVEVLREERARDGEGDLRAERLERRHQQADVVPVDGGHDVPVRIAAARERREHEPVVGLDGVVGDAQGASELGRRLAERGRARRGPAGDPGGREHVEPGRLGPRPVRGGDDVKAVLLDVDDPDRDRPPDERLDGLDGGRVDLFEPGRAHQREAGVAQGALAGDDALLLADEARHARDDQAGRAPSTRR